MSKANKTLLALALSLTLSLSIASPTPSASLPAQPGAMALYLPILRCFPAGEDRWICLYSSVVS